jgi:hypothetical protein
MSHNPSFKLQVPADGMCLQSRQKQNGSNSFQSQMLIFARTPIQRVLSSCAVLDVMSDNVQ